MTHPSESQHWYTRDGSPQYTVKAKDGSDRPATLRDARKLTLVPSVTAIIRCAAAPGLEIWKQQQVLLAALTLPLVAEETEKAYLERILADSKEQARRAAHKGTEIHAAIQGYFQKETPDPAFMPHIQSACEAIEQWAGAEFEYECCSVEQSFAHQLGFGGKVDICGTSPLFVADFKTKEFDDNTELGTRDEQAMQLAAYRHGLGMDGARCAIVYVSSTTPGLAKLIEFPEAGLQKGWTMFYSLLHYWQARACYKSSFEKVAA